MQNIDESIESLLREKGITQIEPEVKEELKADMKDKLLDQINRAAVQSLSEDEAANLAKLIENPDFTNEKMTQFIQNSSVDLTNITSETMARFKKFYLGTEE